MGKLYQYSYLLNIYEGWLIHLYFDKENCMGIECKSILLKSMSTQTNKLVVIFFIIQNIYYTKIFWYQ